MKTLRDQLFHQYISLALRELLEELRQRYEPKKGDRFFYQGITYEIGPAQFHEEGIEFEISSKIPQEEFIEKDDLLTYFDRVKALLLQNKHPELVAIERENIIREIKRDETKERDYVKLRYRYRGEELFSDEEVQKKLALLQKDPSAFVVPPIPEVNTLAGRLVLLTIKENMYTRAKQHMLELMEANETVRQEFRTEGRVKTPQEVSS
ncbi:MAG: hypothetical protein D6736_16555 [Nitrospinota bacterium]|nr:MAG: hypothetical protein D6736_16555 [Nitrospinota bacterium]